MPLFQIRCCFFTIHQSCFILHIDNRISSHSAMIIHHRIKVHHNWQPKKKVMIGIMATIIISELVSSANFIMWCVYMKRFDWEAGPTFSTIWVILLESMPSFIGIFLQRHCGWLIAAGKKRYTNHGDESIGAMKQVTGTLEILTEQRAHGIKKLYHTRRYNGSMVYHGLSWFIMVYRKLSFNQIYFLHVYNYCNWYICIAMAMSCSRLLSIIKNCTLLSFSSSPKSVGLCLNECGGVNMSHSQISGSV